MGALIEFLAGCLIVYAVAVYKRRSRRPYTTSEWRRKMAENGLGVKTGQK